MIRSAKELKEGADLQVDDQVAGELPPTIEGDLYDKYISEYVNQLKNSFLTALGQFVENLGSYRDVDWIIFILCCIFNIIVLLNLLIAIISETYAQISETKDQTGYKEKAVQIGFMQDSVYGFRKSKPDPNQLVFIAKAIKSDVGEG